MMQKCVLIVCFMSLVLRSVGSASVVDVGSTTSGDNGTGTSTGTGTGTGTDTGTSGTGTDNDYEYEGLPDDCTWAPWGDCSVTCGTGTRRRFRWTHCEGPHIKGKIDEKPCDNPICYGSWGPWTSWTDGPCSVTCGVGTQKFTRERHCSTEGGCIGDHSEQKQLDCKNLQPCQGECSWSSSGTCNVTCCVAPQRGLTNCNETDHTANVETKACTYGACAGAWSPWSPWINGTCSVTCGDGKHTSTRIRHCLITGPCTGVGMENKQLDCKKLPPC